MPSERLRKASNRVREIFFCSVERFILRLCTEKRQFEIYVDRLVRQNSRTENECFFGKKEIYDENIQMISIIVSK